MTEFLNSGAVTLLIMMFFTYFGVCGYDSILNKTPNLRERQRLRGRLQMTARWFYGAITTAKLWFWLMFGHAVILFYQETLTISFGVTMLVLHAAFKHEATIAGIYIKRSKENEQ